MAKIYNLNQIIYGSLVGGPIAAAYYVGKNFQLMGNRKAQKNVIAIGLITAMILSLVALLPFELPSSVVIFLGIVIATAAYRTAKERQVTFILEQSTNGLRGASNINVAYVALLGILGQVALVAIGVLSLKVMGYEVT
jgi:hypothetical protein